MAPETVPIRACDITQPKSERSYKATNVISKLLRVVGAEVCSFRRNHQVAYRLVEHSRNIYDAINARIHLVDANDSWEDYEIYTQAIDPLEELLLKIVPAVFDERELNHFSTSSWAEYVRVTGQWHENTLAIRNCFRDMRTKPQFQALMGTLMDDEPEDDVLRACALDDLSYMDYLLRMIGESVQQIADLEPTVKGCVKKIADGIRKTSDLQRNKTGKHTQGCQELNMLLIQCAQIASRMVVMMVDASVSKGIRDSLMSDISLWGTLAQLVIDIYSFMVSQLIPKDSKRTPGSYAQTDIMIIIKFKARYDEVVKMVDKLPVSNLARVGFVYVTYSSTPLQVPSVIEIPQTYSRLLPLVGEIDRRYHAQSLLLVTLCRQATSSLATRSSICSRNALERALDQTIAALEAAGRHAGSWSGRPFNSTRTNSTPKRNDCREEDAAAQDSIDDCARLYERSVEELTACFQIMDIQNGVDHRERLRQARSKDDARVAEVNEKLAEYEHPSAVEVTVDIHENTRCGQKIGAFLFDSIPSTARLEYLKYIIVSQLEGQASAQSGHFELEDGGNNQSASLSLDSEVKDAIGHKGAVVFIVHQSDKNFLSEGLSGCEEQPNKQLEEEEEECQECQEESGGEVK
ncbi:unnamed protein product [Rhizoctonia solani]|uniref:Uncharacterized protein n=1 Tax=Rhizoctonia solani TaxID=456999 RepID=A0A8H2X9Y2_9AGAM|nr:unnamed protein product [Rhizoctonia solani]